MEKDDFVEYVREVGDIVKEEQELNIRLKILSIKKLKLTNGFNFDFYELVERDLKEGVEQ